MSSKKAFVRILNKTGAPMINVKIVHKYSDLYKNDKTWIDEVPNNEYTQGPLEVDYNTGFLTFGKDWWLVAWNDQ